MSSRYAFYDRYRLVFYLLILGMGVYFLFDGYRTNTQAHLLATQGAVAKGQILSKRTKYRRYDPDGLGRRLHLLSYRYKVGGAEFVNESGVPVQRYETSNPGDTVPVRYARNAPDLSELTEGTRATMARSSFLFAFVALGMVVLMFVVDRVRDRLRRA